MPTGRLTRFLLLPELKFTQMSADLQSYTTLYADKTSDFEVCPRCATASKSVYDHREVTIKDAPIRDRNVRLRIRKRRFWCKPCRKPFTEPIAGVSKGKRHTSRFRRELLWRCEHFSDLKRVRKSMDCSSGFMYGALYDELSQRRKEQTYPWPSRIGIDEHSFRKNKNTGRMDFVTFIIDQKNKKAFEVAHGRAVADLDHSLRHIPGRENVQLVTMDLSDTYRQFTKRYFTNARIIADKFHVVRLLNPAINRYRKAITGDRRTLPVRRLLLKNGDKLSFHTRSALWNWLGQHPDLRELYAAKEAIHRLYRITTYDRARSMLKNLIERLHTTKLPELQTLRRTLRSWFDEILNYFKWRITNARVEGYNNVAKLIKKRAYGYRSFENYRLRLLHACA